MIALTKLNDREILLNFDMIEMIESTPDTTITMTTGRKFIVQESADEILDRIVAFKQRVYNTRN